MTRYVFNVAGGVSGLWQVFTWWLCDFYWLYNKWTLRDNKEIPVICSLIVLITVFMCLRQKDKCMPMFASVVLPLKSHKFTPHSWSGWIYMYIFWVVLGYCYFIFDVPLQEHGSHENKSIWGTMCRERQFVYCLQLVRFRYLKSNEKLDTSTSLSAYLCPAFVWKTTTAWITSQPLMKRWKTDYYWLTYLLNQHEFVCLRCKQTPADRLWRVFDVFCSYPHWPQVSPHLLKMFQPLNVRSFIRISDHQHSKNSSKALKCAAVLSVACFGEASTGY